MSARLMAALSAVTLCCAAAALWFGQSQPALPAATEKVVLESDHETWMAELRSGHEVEFRRDPVSPPVAEEKAPPATGSVVRTMGPPSSEQLQRAVDHMTSLLANAENRYRTIPTGTPEDEIRSLEEGYAVTLYSAALSVIREGKAWYFISGNSDDYSRARRSVPRKWKAICVGNVAQTADGKNIDMIVPVDPGQFPELQSMIEQTIAAKQVMEKKAKK